MRPVKKPAPGNGPITLKFDRRETTEADLVFVRKTLAECPGDRRVELVFLGENGQRLRMTTDAGLTVNFNKDLEGHLARWIQR